MSIPRFIYSTYRFYLDGFRSMTVGRKLWLIILIKLVVIFAVIRLFFFTPALSGTDEQKARAVGEALVGRQNIQFNPFNPLLHYNE